MRTSVRFGRVFGIPVGINWSLLAVALLLTVALAGGRFPDAYPNESTLVNWGVAALTAVVFFASVLAHELAHAVVARRHGVGVDGITLWLFGGVARLDGEAPNAGASATIAAAGPATSLAASVSFAALAFLGDASGVIPGVVLSGLWWLAAINLVLAIFNLVPAAPLDGGRLLAALWWWRTGDRRRAAVVAARVGRAFGGGLVALGLVGMLLGGGFSGLWFAMIGWFLMGTARAEEVWANAEHDLRGITVGDVMSRPSDALPGWKTVDSLAGDTRLLRHDFFPVESRSGDVVGLLDVDRLRRVPWERRASVKVVDATVPLRSLVLASPDERLVDVLTRVSGEVHVPIPVFDSVSGAHGQVDDALGEGSDGTGALVGLVTRSDVSRAARISALRREGGVSESAA